MEAFSKLMLRAVDRGFIQGFERKELLCGGGEGLVVGCTVDLTFLVC